MKKSTKNPRVFAATLLATSTALVAGACSGSTGSGEPVTTTTTTTEIVAPKRSGCTVSRDVDRPSLTETVALSCGQKKWTGTRERGNKTFTTDDQESVDGWDLTRITAGPMLSPDGNDGVAVVITLTNGDKICEAVGEYSADNSSVDVPATSDCGQFGLDPEKASA